MFVEKSIVSKRFLLSFDNIKLYCTKKGEGTFCFPHLFGLSATSAASGVASATARAATAAAGTASGG